MTLTLYAHPFSSYCQKALIALYENETPFTFRHLGSDDPSAFAELARLWQLRKFPVLVDGDRTVIEASIIIEHLGLHHTGPVRLIPADASAALDVRFMDRVFDNQVQTPMQRIVSDALRPAEQRDRKGVEDARAALDTIYGWLDDRMAGREWATEPGFSLADCSAAPALFYADWTHPISTTCRHLRAYRERLNQRPSFARLIEEARPYRSLFPLGAPDRD